MTSETFSATDAVAPSDVSFAARNKLVINILLVSTFVVFLNETFMNVAIPQLMASFHAPASAAQWLTTAFLLTMAVIIPVTGFLLQRMNTRPVFILAMSLFSLGTLAAVFAPSLELLIAARVIQASGTAIMMPLLMTTVMTLVAPEARGKTMGNISIVMSVAPALGPALAGIILQYLEWRFMFILVLPISLGALALGFVRMVNVTTPRYAPLDVASVIISALAFGGVVYGLSGLGVPSEPGSLPFYVPLAVGVVAMVIFIYRQISLQKTNSPLLDLRTFGSKNFTISVTMMAVAMMALFGALILLPLYMQNVLGLTTLHTGLILLPGGLLMGLLGPQVGKLYDKVGPTKLLVPGIVIVSAVLWAMTLLTPQTPWGFILAGHVVMSVGFAFLFTPLFTASLGSIPMQFYSHGSAILGSIQQVAGAAGVAVFIALMTARTAALTAAGEAPIDALSDGIRTGFLCGAIISLFAIGIAFFVKKPDAQPGMGGH